MISKSGESRGGFKGIKSSLAQKIITVLLSYASGEPNANI